MYFGKTAIKEAEFNKRVEMEAAYLMYMERMRKEDAFRSARWYVGRTYEIKNKTPYVRDGSQKTA